MPLLAIGAITDILNVTVVLLILAAVVGAMAVISRVMDVEDAPESAEERVAQSGGTS